VTVEAIRLQRFMAFEESGWLPLRPLTLLYGHNSSGKSVVLRALRLLQQSLDQPAGGPHLALATEHGVDMGSFPVMAHQQQGNAIVAFHFRCTLSPELAARLGQWLVERAPGDAWPAQPKWADLCIGYGWNAGLARVELYHLRLATPRRDDVTAPGVALLVADRYDSQTAEELGYEWELSQDIDWQSEAPDLWRTVRVEIPDGCLPRLYSAYAEGFDETFDLLRDLLDELRQTVTIFLSSIEYIGPVRPEPRRHYYLNLITEREWSETGLASYPNFLRDHLNFTAARKIDFWVHQLGLGREVSKPVALYSDPEATVSRLALKETDSLPPINLKDMGYGAAQVLPVLVACVSVKPGALVIIEQPELHLHPSAQAVLGDVFINALRQSDNLEGAPRFLLETHSEHLLLRLRRRVAETTAKSVEPIVTTGSFGDILITPLLDASELATYLVIRREGFSALLPIEIDDVGEYDRMPAEFRDFFSDDTAEIIKLNRARRKAQQEKNDGLSSA
jgi:hypothetical protein